MNNKYEKNINGLISALRDGDEMAFNRLRNQLLDNGFSVSPSHEEWVEISNNFSKNRLPKEKILSILDFFQKDSIVEGLTIKPLIEGYEYLFRKLDKRSLGKLLPQIDDLTKVKCVAKNRNIHKCFANTIMKSISDEYLRETMRKAIFLGDFDLDEKVIKDYMKIRDDIAASSEDKRYMKIIRLDSSEKTRESEDELNRRKISLLNYIVDSTMRETIIATLTPNIDPSLKDNVDKAKKMILKFLTSDGKVPLTQEMQEKIDIVFNSYSVQYADLSDADESSNHYTVEREIKVSDSVEDENKIVAMLIHEFGHAMIATEILNQRSDLFLNVNVRADSIEEGIVQTFTQLVLNHEKKDLDISDTYQEYTAVIKTMLASLPEGEDIKAIKECMLGSRRKFYGMFPGVNLFDDFDTRLRLTPNIVKGLASLNPDFDGENKKVYRYSNHILDSGILMCDDSRLLKKKISRMNKHFDSNGEAYESLYDVVEEVGTEMRDLENAKKSIDNEKKKEEGEI